MCTGGRVVHHLRYNLGRSKSSVVFVGFAAHGTLGRKIIDGAETVKIFGEEIRVKAKIYTIGGFSAHADQQGLLCLAQKDRQPFNNIHRPWRRTGNGHVRIEIDEYKSRDAGTAPVLRYLSPLSRIPSQ